MGNDDVMGLERLGGWDALKDLEIIKRRTRLMIPRL